MKYRTKLDRLRKMVPFTAAAYIAEIVRSSPLTYRIFPGGQVYTAKEYASFRSQRADSVFIVDDIGGAI